MTTASSIIPPELRIIQRTVRDPQLQPHVGKFYNTIDGSIKANVRAVILSVRRTRVYWGHAEFSGTPPTCGSEDASTYISVHGDNCRECPYNAFTDEPWKIMARDRRDYCMPGYTIIGMGIEEDGDLGLPFLLRSHGISAGAARQLESLLAMQMIRFQPGSKRSLKGTPYPIVVLSADEETTPEGSAYALRATTERYMTLSEFEEYREEVETFKALRTSIVTEPLALPSPGDAAPAVRDDLSAPSDMEGEDEHRPVAQDRSAKAPSTPSPRAVPASKEEEEDLAF